MAECNNLSPNFGHSAQTHPIFNPLCARCAHSNVGEAMPRGSAPEWKRRKEPILDDHLRASIAQANGTPDPSNGHYAKLVYAGCPTKERAEEIKRALFRAGRYVKVSVSATVVPAGDGTWQVHFKAIDKSYAKKYMLEKYGSVANFPYDPRRKGKVSAE